MLRDTVKWTSFVIFFIWRNRSSQWTRAFLFTRFLDHTQSCTTVGRTPLDEWSAPSQIPLPDSTHNTHKRHPCPTVGIEPTISAGELPQTHSLDRAASGTIYLYLNRMNFEYNALCEGHIRAPESGSSTILSEPVLSNIYFVASCSITGQNITYALHINLSGISTACEERIKFYTYLINL